MSVEDDDAVDCGRVDHAREQVDHEDARGHEQRAARGVQGRALAARALLVRHALGEQALGEPVGAQRVRERGRVALAVEHDDEPAAEGGRVAVHAEQLREQRARAEPAREHAQRVARVQLGEHAGEVAVRAAREAGGRARVDKLVGGAVDVRIGRHSKKI